MLILVTGASKGIGFEIVKKFSAQPELLVIAVSRNVSSLNSLVKETNSTNILPVRADITKPADVKRIVDMVKNSDYALMFLLIMPDIL